MKKLLILGGAIAQVPLIQAAKKEGYYVVLCDWTTTNPGIPLADKHYQVSTLDLDAVLKVARTENVDGVMSNSEPAMHNVAVVAEQLGLVGNPPRAVDILDSKCDFRKLQKECGLYTPASYEVESKAQLWDALNKMQYPIIVKPSENSGSRGVSVISRENVAETESVYESCRDFSRNKKVTVEEYVQMPSLYNVGGDIFVHHGKILWEGLATCIRTENKKMVPTGEMWPIHEDERHIWVIKDALSQIIQKSGIVHGAYNIEGYFTEADQFFVIEINTRQGGNDIPQLIRDYCGMDMYRLLVTTAVGDDSYYEQVIRELPQSSQNYITNFIVFSDRDKTYQGLEIEPSIRPLIYKITEKRKPGEEVRTKTDATDAAAMVRLRFDNRERQLDFLEKAETCITMK